MCFQLLVIAWLCSTMFGHCSVCFFCFNKLQLSWAIYQLSEFEQLTRATPLIDGLKDLPWLKSMEARGVCLGVCPC